MEDKKTTPSLTDLGKAVLERIHNKDVSMRPRWHFLIRGILFVTMVLFGFAVVIFVGSLAMFIMRMNGTFFMPAFGAPGFGILFWSFPWLVAGFAGLVLLALVYLVKHFQFAYRQPLVYSAVVLFILFLVGSFLFDRVRLHRTFADQALRRHVPFAEPFYRSLDTRETPRVNVGTVAEWTDDGFTMTLRNGDDVRVVVTRQTRLPSGLDLKMGDVVIVLGNHNNGIIMADGLRPVDGEQFRGRMMRPGAPMMIPLVP
ncbi:MAG: hypothetical protein WC052_03490 [Patescibacteria group bacterium]